MGAAQVDGAQLLAAVPIVGRRGIDLSPIDPADPDQLDWMLAFLEPEDVAAQERITQAVQLRSSLGVAVDQGDAFEAVGGPSDPGTLPVIFGISFLCSVEEPARMDETMRKRSGDTIWITDEAIGVLRRLGEGAGLDTEVATTRASVLTHYRDGEVVGRAVRPAHP